MSSKGNLKNVFSSRRKMIKGGNTEMQEGEGEGGSQTG